MLQFKTNRIMKKNMNFFLHCQMALSIGAIILKALGRAYSSSPA